MNAHSCVAGRSGIGRSVSRRRGYRCCGRFAVRTIAVFALLTFLQTGLSTEASAQLADQMRFSGWEFQVGPQFFKYTYTEPDLMEETGVARKGVRAVARYTTRRGMVALEASGARWEVDYDGHGYTEDGDLIPIQAYKIPSAFTEARLLGGYNVRVTPNSALVLFAGGGLRIKTDDISRFAGGYRRNSRYLYLPFGIDYHREVDDRFRYELRFEADWLVEGRQTSYLSDLNSEGWSPDGDPVWLGIHYEDAINTQKSGSGFRISNAIVKARGSGMHFELRLFYRYWNIPESEHEMILITLIEQNGTVRDKTQGEVWEPKNTTSEWGLSGGVWF